MIPTISPCSTSNDTSFSAQELFRTRSPVESPERSLPRIDNRIDERVILFLRFAYGVFLTEIADADDGVIGGHETNRSEVCDTIMVYVKDELKYRHHCPLHGWHRSVALRYVCVTAYHLLS